MLINFMLIKKTCNPAADVSFCLGNLSLTEEMVDVGVAIVGETDTLPILPIKVIDASSLMPGKCSIFLAGDNVNVGLKTRHTRTDEGMFLKFIMHWS